MTTILYPTRGGDNTHRNQDWAFELARERNARLILLYVSNVRFLNTMRTPVSIDRVWEELDEMGEFLLTMAQDRADKVGLKVEKRLRHGSFRQALKEVIEEEDVSVVVLGRPGSDTAITTAEFILEVADFLTAETGAEVFLVHEGEVFVHLVPGNSDQDANSTQLE